MGREIKRFDTAKEVTEFIKANGKEVEKSIIDQDDEIDTNGYNSYYVEISNNKIVDAWRETYSSYVSIVSFLR